MSGEAELLAELRAAEYEYTDTIGSRADTVKWANELAWKAGRDVRIRALATEITAGCDNVLAQGGAELGAWLRDNVRYTRETPGVEVLQGPFATIGYGTGDCDDLAIAWCALATSIGIPAYVAAVSTMWRKEVVYIHAIGFAPGSDLELLELTDDARYGGGMHGLNNPYLPDDGWLTYYDPLAEDFGELDVDPAPRSAGPAMGLGLPLLALGILVLARRRA